MKFIFLFLLSFNCLANIVPDKDADGNTIQKIDMIAAMPKRNFRGHGITCAVALNVETTCEFAVPYPVAKFNGVQIHNSSNGDIVHLKVLDTPTGAYTQALTGTAVPNALLKQFGFDWNTGNDMKETLPYAAEINQGMRLALEYTSKTVAKNIYINFYLHEEEQ